MKIKFYVGLLIVSLVLSVTSISCDGDKLGSYSDPNPITTVTAPVLNSINPDSGMANDTVTITGTGFNTNPDNNFVSFESSSGTVVSSTSTELRVVLPDITNDTVNVKIGVKGCVYWSNSVKFLILHPAAEGE